jgi:hypothetical protein
MNRYILIRRLRGPAILLLIGVLALMDESGMIHHFWHLFWPLLFITIGVLLLAERAALAGEDMYPPSPYPPYPGGNPNAAQGGGAAQPGAAIVPAQPRDPEGHDFGSGSNGGEL